MIGIDPGTAAVLLILGACLGVELTRIAIDWNHEPKPGGTMRHPTALVTTIVLALALLFAACDPAEPIGCFDIEHDRVFSDVPAEHPLCVEIESLYRDGLTSGCRVEDGERYFCPEEPLTRAQGSLFAEHRDPFVLSDLNGRGWIMDHAVRVERFAKGHYWIQFRRDIQFCSMEGWSHSYHGPSIDVRVKLLTPTIDTVEVFTTRDGNPIDMWFNVRLYCQ